MGPYFGVVLVTHVLDKGDDIVSSVSGYPSIQFSAGADSCHSVVKGQRVRSCRLVLFVPATHSCLLLVLFGSVLEVIFF